MAAILLLADGERKRVGKKRKMAVSSTAVWAAHLPSLPSSYANFWAAEFASIPSSVRPSEAITKTKTKRRRRRKTSERRMNICKLQRATPLDGSRFTDHSEGRAEGRNVLVIITREAAAAAARDDLARRLVIAVGIDIRANTGDMHQN